MTDDYRENRRLWNEWSDAFQALWNADTDESGVPPAPTPFDPDGRAATGSATTTASTPGSSRAT